MGQRAEYITKLLLADEPNGCCNKIYMLFVNEDNGTFVGCKCKTMFPMTEAARVYFAENPDFQEILLIPFLGISSSRALPQYFKADPLHDRFKSKRKALKPRPVTTTVPTPSYLKKVS